MNQAVEELETVLGGEELEVRLVAGGTERVLVRQLALSQYTAYLATMDDEAAQIELLCDRPAGWADGLEPGSVEAVLEAGDRLNADFFARWLRRRVARQERIRGQLSGASSRTSPSEAAIPSRS